MSESYYFMAPDGDDCPTLWWFDGDIYHPPKFILRQTDLPRSARHLWGPLCNTVCRARQAEGESA